MLHRDPPLDTPSKTFLNQILTEPVLPSHRLSPSSPGAVGCPRHADPVNPANISFLPPFLPQPLMTASGHQRVCQVKGTQRSETRLANQKGDTVRQASVQGRWEAQGKAWPTGPVVGMHPQNPRPVQWVQQVSTQAQGEVRPEKTAKARPRDLSCQAPEPSGAQPKQAAIWNTLPFSPSSHTLTLASKPSPVPS